MENNNIINKIWQICSNVRGLMSVEQMQQTVIAFTFLRRVDCLVGKYAEECEWFYAKNRNLLSDERLDEYLKKISGGYPFYNFSGYSFWNILRSEYSLDVVLNSYFQGFSKNIQSILDGMNVKQSIAILQRKSRYLVDLFDKFAEIDMSVESISNEDFVYLITSLFNKLKGQRNDNTPLALSKLMSKCLLYKNLYEFEYEDLELEAERDITIYDPVCGIGSMLAITGFATNKISNTSIYGQEVSVYECAVAKALALLSGFKYSQIEYGNTLIEDSLQKRSYQYIIAHLPFGISWEPFKESIVRESYHSNGRFYIGLPKTNDSQFLFIEHILSKMHWWNESRAAFITTESVLKNGNANSGESRIRRWMFQNDKVETIISLPSGILGYAKMPTYLWILSDKKDRKGYVRLIDTSILVKGKTNNFLNDGFVEFVVNEYMSNTESEMTTYVPNDKFGFYEVDILMNGKDRKTITIPVGTDLNDFINKEIQPYYHDDKITVDYPSAEIGYTVQFADFFKAKEEEVLPLSGMTNKVVSVLDEISELKSLVKGKTNLSTTQSVPKKWRKIQLGTVVNVVSGTEKKSLITSTYGLPFLSVSYIRNQMETEERFEKRIKHQYITKKDVLILVKGANSGEVFMGVDGILSSSFVAIRSTNVDVITPRFLYYLLKGYEKQLRSMSKGDYVKSIDKQSLLNFKCLIPPLAEQMKISSYLDSIVNKIDETTKALRSTDNLFTEYRQTLIENVVKGKVRFF